MEILLCLIIGALWGILVGISNVCKTLERIADNLEETKNR